MADSDKITMDNPRKRTSPLVIGLAGGGLVAAGLFGLLAAGNNQTQENAQEIAPTASPTASPTGGGEPTPSQSDGNERGPFPLGVAGLGQPYVFGDTSAPKVVSIWQDIECPACATFEFDSLDALAAGITEGNIQVHYYVVPTERAGSALAALALACASDQNRFKEMQLLFYSNQRPEADQGFSQDEIVELGEGLGLDDASEFRQCVESEAYADYVASIVDLGLEIGLDTTPAVFIDDRRIELTNAGWDEFIRELGLSPLDFPRGSDVPTP